jgi:hypothetical protein
VNCQKRPPPSEIAKKDHLRRGGKLSQKTLALAATAYGDTYGSRTDK